MRVLPTNLVAAADPDLEQETSPTKQLSKVVWLSSLAAQKLHLQPRI